MCPPNFFIGLTGTVYKFSLAVTRTSQVVPLSGSLVKHGPSRTAHCLSGTSLLSSDCFLPLWMDVAPSGLCYLVGPTRKLRRSVVGESRISWEEALPHRGTDNGRLMESAMVSKGVTLRRLFLTHPHSRAPRECASERRGRFTRAGARGRLGSDCHRGDSPLVHAAQC